MHVEADILNVSDNHIYIYEDSLIYTLNSTDYDCCDDLC